jgi:hypothetical protein
MHVSICASFFARRSASVNVTLPAIRAGNGRRGLDVEVGVPGPHLEADPTGWIPVEHEHAVPEDAVHEVNRGSIQHDQLDRRADGSLDLGLEVEMQAGQRPGRLRGEQDGHVDVAGRRRRPAGHAPEQVGRGDRIALRAEHRANAPDEIGGRPHTVSIRDGPAGPRDRS